VAAIRYFLGMTKPELETALADARADLLSGASLQSGGAGDSTFAFNNELPPQRRIELILEELSILDPVAYPPAAVNPPRCTVGRFRDR
jgi:hypothetical protein